MSEDKTKEISDTRSFEERVFMRFDALDARFDAIEARLDRVEERLERVEERLERVEARVENLEMKQYDTRPIWEQAMAAIAETNSRIEQFEPFFAETTSRMGQFEKALTEGFADLRVEVAHSIHGVERKIDSLNHNILQMQADQRYADQRLEKLESQISPT